MQDMFNCVIPTIAFSHAGWFDLLNDAWALMVDLVSIGFLLWVATGLYIGRQLPGMCAWGAVGLLAGLLSFAGFLLLLYLGRQQAHRPYDRGLPGAPGSSTLPVGTRVR